MDTELNKSLKTKEWEPLIAVVQRLWNDFSAFTRFIDGFPKEDQALAALALSVAKWHPANWAWLLAGERSGEYKENRLKGRTCGLCLFHTYPGSLETCCGDCPLESCLGTRTLWSGAIMAYYLHDAGIKNPKIQATFAAMFNKLVSLYEKELNKRGAPR